MAVAGDMTLPERIQSVEHLGIVLFVFNQPKTPKDLREVKTNHWRPYCYFLIRTSLNNYAVLLLRIVLLFPLFLFF